MCRLEGNGMCGVFGMDFGVLGKKEELIAPILQEDRIS